MYRYNCEYYLTCTSLSHNPLNISEDMHISVATQCVYIMVSLIIVTIINSILILINIK